MGSVAVVTDTCHYLPRQLVAARGIHEVSLYVHWDGREDRESELPDFDAYYAHLGSAPTCRRRRSRRSATSSPSTSRCSRRGARSSRSTSRARCRARSPPPSRRASSCRAAAASASTSSTRASACGGEGLVVLAAHAAAARGASARGGRRARARGARGADDVVRDRHARVPASRGGRIGAAQAWLGAALKIKPILTLEEEITPVERVRTSGRAFERMVDYLRARHDDGADAWVVQHIQAPDEAERLIERGREIFGTDPLLRLRGRPRHRDARRPGPARRRRDPEPLPLLTRARAARISRRQRGFRHRAIAVRRSREDRRETPRQPRGW